MSKTKKGGGTSQVAQKKKRTRLSQSDVPSSSLEQALRIIRAMSENYAGGPVTPLQLADALDMSPSSSAFRALCGASIAYGLTEGGYNAQEIKITPLGDKIVKPLAEGDEDVAKREAVLNPRVIGEFLNKYSGSPLPRQDIALNVLESMGVPKEKTENVYSLLLDNAQSVGLMREIKGKQYIDFSSTNLGTDKNNVVKSDHEDVEDTTDKASGIDTDSLSSTIEPIQLNRKVFITHGKNKAFIDPIKKLLGFGELTPVVSVEQQSVSKPVPEKFMDDMRSCGAAIIHVADEIIVEDKYEKAQVFINPNVLIEIGAAMALYGQRFILLVKEGVELPSNLQGLYEVRYKGETLDGNATIKLLEAINDIKNNPMPNR